MAKAVKNSVFYKFFGTSSRISGNGIANTNNYKQPNPKKMTPMNTQMKTF